MVTREEKLERVVKAALRMRRKMRDFHAVCMLLGVPRAEVEAFDALIKELKDGEKTIT